MNEELKELASKEYKEGFVTDIEQEYVPKGLSEDIIRMISGYSRTASENEQKMMPFSANVFLKVVATLTESNTASTATLE